MTEIQITDLDSFDNEFVFHDGIDIMEALSKFARMPMLIKQAEDSLAIARDLLAQDEAMKEIERNKKLLEVQGTVKDKEAQADTFIATAIARDEKTYDQIVRDDELAVSQALALFNYRKNSMEVARSYISVLKEMLPSKNIIS